MNGNSIVAWAAALGVLILFIIMLFSGGPDEETLAKAEALEAAEARIADLEGRIEALTAAVDEGAAGDAETAEAVASLSDGVEKAGSRADGAAATAAAVEARLESEVDALHHAIADIAAAGETSLKTAVSRLEAQIGAGGGDAPAAEAPAAEAEAEPEPEPEGSGAGEIISFSDELRIFVSRVDGAGGVARIAVNGRELVEARTGDRFEAADGACAATVEAIRDDRLILASDC